MNHELSITTTQTINAPVSRVWKALTDPELIKQYFFGTETESNWEKGSPIIFRGEWEGQKYEEKGTILDIKKEEFLKYNYFSSMSGLEDKPENYAIITYKLNTKNSQTIIEVTQKGFKDREAFEHSKENWKQVLKGLKSVAESG